jgi:hypothetical protein
VAAGDGQDARTVLQKEITVRVLTMLWKWWRECWSSDLYWPTVVDSHQWDNKTEILRRLSSGSY